MRHRELRRAVFGEGGRVHHRRRRGGVAVRALRHLVRLLLRQRGAGADRCRHRHSAFALACARRAASARRGSDRRSNPSVCLQSLDRKRSWRRSWRRVYASRSATSAPFRTRSGVRSCPAPMPSSQSSCECGEPAARATVGRKVGFANKAMWRVLKLDTLVWAHMYDDTAAMRTAATRRWRSAGCSRRRSSPRSSSS